MVYTASIGSRKRLFQMIDGDNPIFMAAYKRGSRRMGIVKSEDPYCNDSSLSLFLNPKNGTFSLRNNTLSEQEIFSFSIQHVKHEKGRARKIQAFYNGQVFVSAFPQRMRMKWFLDLHSDRVIPSVKNFQIRNSADEPVIFIRKKTMNSIEIECIGSFDPQILFSLGIGVCI